MKDLQAQLILIDWLDRESTGNSQVYLAEEEKIISAMKEYATLKLSERQNNFDKMKEALLKASKLLQAAAIEAQRPEVEKYLSGGYRQTLENAVFKDSLGIEQLLESLK